MFTFLRFRVSSSTVPSAEGSGSGNLRMPLGFGNGLDNLGSSAGSSAGCSSTGGLSSPPQDILKAVESSLPSTPVLADADAGADVWGLNLNDGNGDDVDDVSDLSVLSSGIANVLTLLQSRPPSLLLSKGGELLASFNGGNKAEGDDEGAVVLYPVFMFNIQRWFREWQSYWKCGLLWKKWLERQLFFPCKPPGQHPVSCLYTLNLQTTSTRLVMHLPEATFQALLFLSKQRGYSAETPLRNNSHHDLPNIKQMHM